MKNKLYKVEDIVKEILEHDVQAREDDYYLMYKVILKTNPEDLYKPYVNILTDKNNRRISFKSVERARRKVQSNCPWLKPKEEIQKQRLEYESMYIDYAIDSHIPSLY